MFVSTSAKYAIIREMTQRNNNLLNITWLCTAAGVSRSGYYHYIDTEYLRHQREEQDRKDFMVILEAYQFRGYNKGARGIYMRLLHMVPPLPMNIKKIRRLMNKYGLFCPIRKANPYRRMAKALKTSNVAPNLYVYYHRLLYQRAACLGTMRVSRNRFCSGNREPARSELWYHFDIRDLD